ncbi:MAG: VOC family protein [Allorhizobium sp.]
MMTKQSYTLLYVADPLKSVDFYEQLLGRPRQDAFPTFASIALNDNHVLGLWANAGVTPSPTKPGGSEVALVVGSKADVDRTYEAWKGYPVSILQEPTDMVFGRTFCVADPDGHRIRVMSENDPA